MSISSASTASVFRMMRTQRRANARSPGQVRSAPASATPVAAGTGRGWGMDVIRRALVALALSLALLAGQGPAGLAEAAPAPRPTPEQVRQLLGLLADPAVRDRIARGAPAPPAADSPSPPAQQPVTLGQYLRERLAKSRPHLAGLATPVPP